MSETLLLIIKIVGIYLSGMGVAYIFAAKVVGYDNMVSDEQEVANGVIVFSWIGIAVFIVVALVFCLKLLLDAIFKIKNQ